MGALLLVAFITCLVQPLGAQESRGTVRGVVSDPTHAVVPGAKVTLHNTATGVEMVRQTDTSGSYVFDPVLPGTYSVIVEATGFEKFVQENMGVQTAADITANAVLTVGSVTQAVEVTSSGSQVEFNTSTMSYTIQNSLLKDLPILGRNPFTLALLDAGVINQYWDEAHRLPFYMWSDGGMDVGGPTSGKNELIIDGTRTDMAARGSYNAPMDAVQEVVVQQNIPDAEHGWSAGGAVNISMKSGTNDIHGDAYGLWRQPGLNALSNRVTRAPDIVKQNIYGFTVGNPIIKNKLFNFFAYEKWYTTQPSTAYETMATPAEAQGDFSQAIQNDGQPRFIYDPTTTVFNPTTDTVTRTPISCQGKANVICPSAINPTGKILQSYMWGPNTTALTPDGSNNWQSTFAWWTKYHNLSERVDFNISDKWRMYGHYSWFRTHLDNDNPTANDSIAFPSQNGGIMDATSSGIDVLYMMNPRTTLDIRLGVNYTEDDFNSTIYKLKSTPCASGSAANVNCNVWPYLWPNTNYYQPLLAPTIGIYFPNFSWSGIASGSYSAVGNGANTGAGGWWYDHLRNYSPTIIVTHEMGKHHMKFGWQYRYAYAQNFQSVGPGSFYFNSEDTAAVCCGLAYTPDQSGDQWASSLLGIVDSGDATIYPIIDQIHNHLYGGFVQDDFRLNPRTTLNLGIRWEHETGPQDNNHWLIKTLDLTQAIPNWPSNFTLWTPGVLAAANLPASAANIPNLVVPNYTGQAIRTTASDPTVFSGSNSLFLPRAGIAYRLSDKTALRAGYSRFAVTWLSNGVDDGIIQANGYQETTYPLSPLEGIPRSYLDNPYPTGGAYPNPVIQAVGNTLGPYTDLGNSWNSGFYDGRIYKVPINDRFNFNLQRQIPAQFRFDATLFMMFEHNAQDGSMWGGFGSTFGTNYNTSPQQHNYNMMNPMYSYQYQGLLNANVPNPFYNQFPTGPSTAPPGYSGPYMPGVLGTESTVPLSQLLQPYPQYGSLWLLGWPGNRDHYYGIALSVTRPMSHGWTFLGTYNYSIQNHTTYYNDIATYANDLQMFDRGYPRHNLRLSGTYQLPFGRGKKYFTNVPKWVDEIIGGWTTSQIFYWMSGDLLPFPTSGMVCNPTQNIPTGYWFNPNCITTPPAYTIATDPPYYEGMRGPRYWDLDSTAVKNFKINERFTLEFRLEMYNMPNSFIPGDPNECGPSQCGNIGGKSTTEAGASWGANYGRELQGSLRLNF